MSRSKRSNLPSTVPVTRRRQVTAARALLGWTRADLAREAGVGRDLVNGYENGWRGGYGNNSGHKLFEALYRAGVRFTTRGVDLVAIKEPIMAAQLMDIVDTARWD